MSKATPTDLIQLGFDAGQFGDPTDWDVTEPAGYLQQIIDWMALEVMDQVGDALYTAASPDGTPLEQLQYKRLRTAESYRGAAELWRRIEMFERQTIVQGRGENKAETIGSRALNNAELMDARADGEIERVTVRSLIGGIATGTIESGMFKAVTS